jgi:hypothetical protein
VADGPPSRLSIGRVLSLDRPYLLDLDAFGISAPFNRRASEPFCRVIAGAA